MTDIQPSPELARAAPLEWGRYCSDGRFESPRHLAFIEHQLLRIADGSCKRLMIFAPPRHGKSDTSSMLFAGFYLGTFPDRRVAVVSHSEELAATHGRRARDMLVEHGRLIFGVSVRQDVKAASRWDLAPPHRGGFLAVGVNGTLTGKGFDLIIFDDVLKDSNEADSEAYRRSLKAWYTTTARSRLQPGGAIIHLQTRWHEDDLAGWLLEEAKKGTGEQWEVLRLPAVAEDDDPLGREPGEALWPERMPLAELEAARLGAGGADSRAWTALWQQRPRPQGGALFKGEWLASRYAWVDSDWNKPHVTGVLPGSPGFKAVQIGSEPPIDLSLIKKIAAVDVALSTRTTADYTVIAILGQLPDGRVILLDLLRRRMEAPDLVRSLKEFAIGKWGCAAIYVERAGVGLAIVQEARKTLPILEVAADKDKVSRALPLAAAMEAKRFLLPVATATNQWLVTLVDELLAFPQGRHDDQVDALSHGWTALNKPRPTAGGMSGILGL